MVLKDINESSVLEDENERISPISRWAERMLTDFHLDPEKLNNAIFWYFMFSPTLIYLLSTFLSSYIIHIQFIY